MEGKNIFHAAINAMFVLSVVEEINMSIREEITKLLEVNTINSIKINTK